MPFKIALTDNYNKQYSRGAYDISWCIIFRAMYCIPNELLVSFRLCYAGGLINITHHGENLTAGGATFRETAAGNVTWSDTFKLHRTEIENWNYPNGIPSSDFRNEWHAGRHLSHVRVFHLTRRFHEGQNKWTEMF
jgi:hypothetical protein